MKLILIGLTLLISGCATKPVTQNVNIPILTKCYEGSIPEQPILITDNIKKDTDIDIALSGALSDIKKMKIYSKELKIMICK